MKKLRAEFTMGIIRDHALGKHSDPSIDPENLEEQYQRLYMKISRDFVHRKDLEAMLSQLTDLLTSAVPGLAPLIESSFSIVSSSAAKSTAIRYKKAVESGDSLLPFAESDLGKIDDGDE